MSIIIFFTKVILIINRTFNWAEIKFGPLIVININVGDQVKEDKIQKEARAGKIRWPRFFAFYLVRQIYKQIFNREADPGGLETYGSSLRHGEKNVREIVKDMGCSNEFMGILKSKSVAEAVDTCYWHFLGRKADLGGRNYYINELENNHRLNENRPDYQWFVKSLIDSPEYRKKFGNYRIPHNSPKVL